jgi:hypothetical protein
MNIHCVKGVAAYHEFSCACMQRVLLCLSTYHQAQQHTLHCGPNNTTRHSSTRCTVDLIIPSGTAAHTALWT